MNKPLNMDDKELGPDLEKTLNRRAFLKGSTIATGALVAGSGLTLAACEAPQEAPEPGFDEAVGTATGSENFGITVEDIAHSEKVMGIQFTPEERTQIVETIDGQISAMQTIRGLEISNDIAPAQVFNPRLPGIEYNDPGNSVSLYSNGNSTPSLPSAARDIAYAPLTHLSHWLNTGQITSVDLTEIYLDRLDTHAPTLECMVTITHDLARQQAAQADAERAAGNIRGPLHGVPYVVKDLMDVDGVRTTWGAAPYKDRIANRDAAVVERLKEAGAVLLGKSTCGALAYGDIWWGGRTRNPWNINEGSSGSSAGSASATAAGLCGFSIGTETLGSIVSPSTRNGTTGLRPTFGRVSRFGTMALCWSLDKIGPICRGVEDTALVLAAINGTDTRDPSNNALGFAYDGNTNIRDLRVGYIPRFFEDESGANDIDRQCLSIARDLGLNLIEMDIPDGPYGAMVPQLVAEAAAAFEEITLKNTDDMMEWQVSNAWPNSFRQTRFLSAVDLINMDRFRRQVMQMMHDAFKDVDVIIGPNFAGSMLVITNYTGHPQLALKAGFFDSPTRTIFGNADGDNAQTFRVPQTFSVWGKLYGEGPVLTVGRALEEALGVRDQHPPAF